MTQTLVRFCLRVRFVATLAVLCASALPASAQVAPLQHETLVSGVYSPTSLAFLPDDRMLVTQLQGSVLISSPLSLRPVTLSPYLHLTDLNNMGEHGLIEILLDPAFSSNHWFYLFYCSASQHIRVSRFTFEGLPTDTASELVIFETRLPYTQCCHAGGCMAFLADGTLMIGVGDDLTPANAQDLTSDQGKLHRINTDGSVPTNNPYYDGTPGLVNALGVRQSVYAHGIRNPFRGSFDPVSGRMLFGMVGGNSQDIAWEDIRENAAGANHGWPFCGDVGRDSTGACNDPEYADPVYAYPHLGTGASVTGGCFYNGSMWPSEWQGRYLFGDFARGWIRYLQFDSLGAVAGMGAVMDTSMVGGIQAVSVVKIIEAPDGSIYYVSIFDDFVNYTGRIGRLFFHPNTAPACGTLSADPASTTQGSLTTTLSASATDAEGDPLQYVWSFGDNTPNDTGAAVQHFYSAPGLYQPIVVVSDGVNSVSCGAVPVSVGAPPVVQITSPADGSTFHAGDVITLTGSATDDGPLNASNYSWTVVFHHNDHIHPETGASGTTDFDLIVPTVGHGFADSTWYEITLVVTDADGLSATTSINLYPEKVSLTITTVPVGAEILYEGEPRPTPFTIDQAIGQQVLVGVVDAQPCMGGEGYTFQSWSDGLPQIHPFVVPEGGDTLVAHFTSSGECAYCGEAMGFDGTDDRLSITPFIINGDWTIEFWLRADPGLSTADAILGNTTDLSLDLKNGRLHLFKYSDKLTSSQSVVANQWDHYAITRTAGVPRLYINGVQDAGASTLNFNGATIISFMGKGINPGFLKGGLDEVRIWSVARTQQQIAANMGVLMDPATPGLTAYWRFDGPAGTQTVEDLTGHGHTAVRGVDAGIGTDEPVTFASSGPMQFACTHPVVLQVKALLQGPFDPGTGLMNDDLRSLGLIPAVEPYSALGFTLLNPGAQVAPGVLAQTGNNAIVDWVLIELRDAQQPATVLGRLCALLQRDGDVVGTDGVSLPATQIDRPACFVALRHRNHLGVMSLAPVATSTPTMTADFSSAQLACFGTQPRLDHQGWLLLWAGNTNLDALLKYVGASNDSDPILNAIGGTVPTNVSSGYNVSDVNLDGRIKYTGQKNDRDIILQNVGGTTFNNTRTEQLP